jgi:hypothetical protein
MALANSFRPWRITTAARIQAVGSSQPPSWAAFSREAAAFFATKPTKSPELEASSDASAHRSRSVLHSYHNTGFSQGQGPIANYHKQLLITSSATSVSTHLDPMNIFLFICFAIKHKICFTNPSIPGHSNCTTGPNNFRKPNICLPFKLCHTGPVVY